MKHFLMGMKHKKMEDTPLSTNFRLPGFMFGSSLDGEEQEVFEKLQRMFRSLCRMKSEKGAIVNLLEISDTIEELYSKSNRSAMMVSSEFFDYLRSKFVGGDAAKMRAAINLLDFLMKNASTYPKNSHFIYYYTSKRRMLKTLARCARDLTRGGSVDSKLRLIGVDILGCLQTWGEAFSSPQRRELYDFYETYKNLEEKYNVSFPFVPYDPHRVPLILSEISDHERKMAMQVAPNSEETSAHGDDSSMDAELGLSGAPDIGSNGGATFIKSSGGAKEAPPQSLDLLSFDDLPESKEEPTVASSLLPAWYTEEPSQPPPPAPAALPIHSPQQYQQQQYQYQYPVQHGSPHLRHPQSEVVRPPPMLPPPASASPYGNAQAQAQAQTQAVALAPMWPAAPLQPPAPLLPGHAPLLTATGDPFGAAAPPPPVPPYATMVPGADAAYSASASSSPGPMRLPALSAGPIRRDNVDRLFPPAPASSSADEELERMVSDLLVTMKTPPKQQQPQPPAWIAIPTPSALTPIPSDVFDQAAESLQAPPPPATTTATTTASVPRENPGFVPGPSSVPPQTQTQPPPQQASATTTLTASLSQHSSVTAKAAAFEELASAKARAHRSRTSTVSSDGEGRSRTSDDIDVVFFGNSRIVKPKTGAEAGADGGEGLGLL